MRVLQFRPRKLHSRLEASRVLLVLAVLSFPTATHSLAGDGGRARSAITLGGGAVAPFAYIVFCLSNPSDCEPTPGETKIDASAFKGDLVSRVNKAVNEQIIPRNDSGLDTWQADVMSGDCEDYVLTKRRRLVAEGVPTRSLRIAVGRLSSGEGHAVLVVATNNADMILDNRFDKIVDWRSSDVRIMKIQSADNPKLWFNVEI